MKYIMVTNTLETYFSEFGDFLTDIISLYNFISFFCEFCLSSLLI